MRTLALTGLAATTMVAAAALSSNEDNTYSHKGPCVPTYSVPQHFEPETSVKLDTKVTLPGGHTSFGPPYPTIFFFNGFQVLAAAW